MRARRRRRARRLWKAASRGFRFDHDRNEAFRERAFLCSAPRLSTPGEQLLRRRPMLPSHDRHHSAGRQGRLDDANLLVIGPAPASTTRDHLNPASLRRRIAQTQRLVEKSLAMVHRFAVELRPTVLDDLGLIPALHTCLKDFMKRTGVRARLIAYAAVNQLPIGQSAVLYRVALEALNNVAIHAQASAVEVQIKKLPDWICLTITDDGKSFNVKRALRTNGNGRLGLLGMRERLEMVGGIFSIKSTAGHGTTVTARIPVSPKGAGKNGKRSPKTKS